MPRVLDRSARRRYTGLIALSEMDKTALIFRKLRARKLRTSPGDNCVDQATEMIAARPHHAKRA